MKNSCRLITVTVLALFVTLAGCTKNEPRSTQSLGADRPQGGNPMPQPPRAEATFEQAATKPIRRPPYSFKGDQVGVMTLDEFAAKYQPEMTPEQIHSFPAYFCDLWGAEVAGEQACSGGPASIADTDASIQYYFLEEKLEAIVISFDRDHFDRIRTSLVHKYGLPVRQSRGAYRNGLGNTFSGLVETWDNGSSEIVLEEIGNRSDASAVEFISKGLRAKREKMSVREP